VKTATRHGAGQCTGRVVARPAPRMILFGMARICSTLEFMTPGVRRSIEEECVRTIAELRKTTCSFDERLEIRIPTILCEDCFGAQVDNVFLSYRAPDVLSESWESDLAIALDEDVAAWMAEDKNSPRCHYCCDNLHGCDLYVETTELSDHLGIDNPSPPIKPNEEQRKAILKGYGCRCFACGSDGPLTIDHIKPIAHGGRAALYNLQPLCKSCNQAKADRPQKDVVAVRDPWSS
jgi:5-methylcytosine-specific restriction endonuclease McrA